MAGRGGLGTMTAHRGLALGRDHVPVWIFDDAHPAPQALRAAAEAVCFARQDGDFYPGVRANPPADYADWLADFLHIRAEWAGMQVLRASFAIAATDPASLLPIQRIPHFDDPDPAIWAAVHYLAEVPHGGTLFFHHRRSGYERITASRVSAWRQALAADSAEHGFPDAAYCGPDDARFTCIGSAGWRPNRLVLYPANCLHAGDIGGSWASRSRLTITALLRLGP